MKRTYFIATMYGWVSAIVLLLLMSACLALAIQLFGITNETIFYSSFIIGLFILSISGFVAGVKGKEKGWLLGAMVGIGFIGMTLFIQYVGLNTVLTVQQGLYHTTYMLAAIIGGIAGVNIINRTV